QFANSSILASEEEISPRLHRGSHARPPRSLREPSPVTAPPPNDPPARRVPLVAREPGTRVGFPRAHACAIGLAPPPLDPSPASGPYPAPVNPTRPTHARARDGTHARWRYRGPPPRIGSGGWGLDPGRPPAALHPAPATLTSQLPRARTCARGELR